MTDDDSRGGPEGLSPDDWQKRRDALAEQLSLQRARLSPTGGAAPKSGGMRGAADGMKLASEFIAGILAGAGIGYLLDRIVGSSPFGLVVFLILGFVAGVLNVLRSVGKTDRPSVPAPKDATKPENSPSN